MSGLESAMNLVRREVALGDEIDARQQITLDKLQARIERMERQLEVLKGRSENHHRLTVC